MIMGSSELMVEGGKLATLLDGCDVWMVTERDAPESPVDLVSLLKLDPRTVGKEGPA